MDSDERGGAEDLGGIEQRENIIGIYYMWKKTNFNKRKRQNKQMNNNNKNKYLISS